MLQHQIQAGFRLRVERVQRDIPAFQVEFLEALAHDGNLVGLLIHQGAAQIILAGHRHGREDAMAAAIMLELFAIYRYQLLFGGWATHLGLESQPRPIRRRGVHCLQGSGKSGLAGRGIPAVGPGTNAQRPTLRLREYFGESRQGLGPAPSAGHNRANRHGYPHVPMDNNAAERALRKLAVARKNFYGSGSEWSGELACGCFTLLATLGQQGICPRRILRCIWKRARVRGQSPGPSGRVSALEVERGKAGSLVHSRASAMSAEAGRRYCGREFSAADLTHIRERLQIKPVLGRVALSRRVCQDFGWGNALGQPKAMSCRVALLRMEKDGLLQLPPPLSKNGGGRRRFELSSASDPREPVQASVSALESLVFQRVAGAKLSSLWNELIQRYHYLGYRPLSGAQMRYLVWSADGRLLAALGFGASAWQVKSRDQYIGWNHPQRAWGLHRIVNNARFLILPWVRCGGLASRILSGIVQPLRADWRLRYGYQPLLLESFVEIPRFTGTAYRAANWIRLGHTQGRGKLEKHHRQIGPRKEIWIYPLHPNFRQILCTSP